MSYGFWDPKAGQGHNVLITENGLFGIIAFP